MPNEKQIELYSNFKAKFPQFIKQEMETLKKYLSKYDNEKINSSTFYHATNNMDNAQAIIDNGFDIWRLNDKKFYEDSNRVGNYIRELGPAVYLAPKKSYGYGKIILKGNVNVENAKYTIRSFWLCGVNDFFTKLTKLAYTNGNTEQEKYIIANRFLNDVMQKNNIDAVFMRDDTMYVTDQLAVFNPKKVKFSL